MSVLQVLGALEPARLRLDARTLLQELGRPTLARLPGEGDAAPRAVAVIQHGDEHTGIDALLAVLRTPPPLPYDLHVLFGNVEAALAPPAPGVSDPLAALDQAGALRSLWRLTLALSDDGREGRK